MSNLNENAGIYNVFPAFQQKRWDTSDLPDFAQLKTCLVSGYHLQMG